MAYSDLASIHNPATGTAAPATWGDQVNDNSAYLYLRGPYICTSASRPGSPFEGQRIYETDTNKCLVYDGALWWTIGIVGIGTTSHTPTLSQGVSANISKTVTYSQYRIINGECSWRFVIDATASGTAGSAATLTLPVTAATIGALLPSGAGIIYDASTTNIDQGSWHLASTTTIQLHTDASVAGAWGASPNIALASGDSLRGEVRFLVLNAA